MIDTSSGSEDTSISSEILILASLPSTRSTFTAGFDAAAAGAACTAGAAG